MYIIDIRHWYTYHYLSLYVDLNIQVSASWAWTWRATWSLIFAFVSWLTWSRISHAPQEACVCRQKQTSVMYGSQYCRALCAHGFCGLRAQRPKGMSCQECRRKTLMDVGGADLFCEALCAHKTHWQQRHKHTEAIEQPRQQTQHQHCRNNSH